MPDALGKIVQQRQSTTGLVIVAIAYCTVPSWRIRSLFSQSLKRSVMGEKEYRRVPYRLAEISLLQTSVSGVCPCLCRLSKSLISDNDAWYSDVLPLKADRSVKNKNKIKISIRKTNLKQCCPLQF